MNKFIYSTIFLCVFAPTQAHALWKQVQSSTNKKTSSVTLNLISTQAVVAGNLLTIQVSNNGGAITGIVDNAGDMWVVDATGTAPGLQMSFIAHSIASSSMVLSSTVTFTSVSFPAGALIEFSCSPGTISVSSVTFGHATSSTTVNIGSVTFNNTSALIIQDIGTGLAETLTPGTGFAAGPFSQYSSGINYGNWVQYQIGTTSSPVSCQATLSAATGWSSVAAAYQSSGDNPPATTLINNGKLFNAVFH